MRNLGYMQITFFNCALIAPASVTFVACNFFFDFEPFL